MDIKPRAMTWNEVKALREAGLDPVKRTDADTRELAKISSETLDYILENIYGENDFDNVPYNELLKLARETYILTMGEDEQTIKNS